MILNHLFEGAGPSTATTGRTDIGQAGVGSGNANPKKGQGAPPPPPAGAKKAYEQLKQEDPAVQYENLVLEQRALMEKKKKGTATPEEIQRFLDSRKELATLKQKMDLEDRQSGKNNFKRSTEINQKLNGQPAQSQPKITSSENSNTPSSKKFKGYGHWSSPEAKAEYTRILNEYKQVQTEYLAKKGEFDEKAAFITKHMSDTKKAQAEQYYEGSLKEYVGAELYDKFQAAYKKKEDFARKNYSYEANYESKGRR